MLKTVQDSKLLRVINYYQSNPAHMATTRYALQTDPMTQLCSLTDYNIRHSQVQGKVR